jgi:hypothetical protein
LGTGAKASWTWLGSTVSAFWPKSWRFEQDELVELFELVPLVLGALDARTERFSLCAEGCELLTPAGPVNCEAASSEIALYYGLGGDEAFHLREDRPLHVRRGLRSTRGEPKCGGLADWRAVNSTSARPSAT